MIRSRGVAPAKVNLALAVTGRREDGFHTLRSIFVRLEVHDELEVATAEDPAAPDQLEIEGDPDTPIDGNLVLRAAAHLRELADRPLPALRFRLAKRIPAAAGLGGGSSDAATALDLAMQRWELRLHPAHRLEAALHLGADVPFFASGHTAALVHGIGEGLHPLRGPSPAAGILLVTPAERLATAEVFAAFDRQPPALSAAPSSALGVVEALATALESRLDPDGLVALAAGLADANDLWPAAVACAPTLVSTRAVLGDVLGRPLLLTGSGPTLFAIYPSGAAAAGAAVDLEQRALPQLRGATIIATRTAEGEHA